MNTDKKHRTHTVGGIRGSPVFLLFLSRHVFTQKNTPMQKSLARRLFFSFGLSFFLRMTPAQVYSFCQARAGVGSTPRITTQASEILLRTAGVVDIGCGGVEESKGEREGLQGEGGARSVIGPAQLLAAVNDILGRADLSLSTEEGELLKKGLRHRGMYVRVD